MRIGFCFCVCFVWEAFENLQSFISALDSRNLAAVISYSLVHILRRNFVALSLAFRLERQCLSAEKWKGGEVQVDGVSESVVLDPPLFCCQAFLRFNCRLCTTLYVVWTSRWSWSGAQMGLLLLISALIERAVEKFPIHEYCRLELHTLAPPLSLQQFERQFNGYRVAEYCVICYASICGW